MFLMMLGFPPNKVVKKYIQCRVKIKNIFKQIFLPAFTYYHNTSERDNKRPSLQIERYKRDYSKINVRFKINK